ncbi:FtsX-like permease family protein [Glycomyces tenuis]|uniref:FtsX-like permease family protein n=1 Tax=Glycomyces tenuis TaxID=58116 RepID=UPI0004036A38|nr:ABC transporter permease [Glycomyces tenuis]
MLALSMRSVRRRPGRFTAMLLSATVGAAVIMAFNSLHDVAAAPGVDSASSEILTIAAAIVGGYGTLLVFISIASTLTVNVRQRSEEIKLLRSAGATPLQIKLMLVGEAALIAVAAVVLAVGPAMLGGRALLEMFQETGQVAAGVEYAFGPIGLGAGVGSTLLASVGAAFMAVRRATRAASGTDRANRGRRRSLLGIAALVLGTGSVLTTLTLDETEPAAMAPAAYGSILIAFGLALFAPSMVGGAMAAFEGMLARTGGSGHLSAHNLRRRASEMSGVLMPMILFVGLSFGTLYMQAVENDALAASGAAKTVEDKNLETMNLVVVGIIAVFACIMLVNSLYAAVSYRGGEFGRQRLAGATPGQVLGMVGIEGVVLTVVGVALGSVAGIAGILPFAALRTDSMLPDQGPGMWIGIAAVAALATLATGLGTARKALRTPAVDAVGLAA